MNTATATTDQLVKALSLLTFTLEKKIPQDLRTTTNARRIASLKRQKAEATESLVDVKAELAKRGQ
jgi:hypothetical protein